METRLSKAILYAELILLACNGVVWCVYLLLYPMAIADRYLVVPDDNNLVALGEISGWRERTPALWYSGTHEYVRTGTITTPFHQLHFEHVRAGLRHDDPVSLSGTGSQLRLSRVVAASVTMAVWHALLIWCIVSFRPGTGPGSTLDS